MSEEIFVPTRFKDYLVSSRGSVKSIKRGKEKILKSVFNKSTGNVQVSLSINGRPSTKIIYKLMVESFYVRPIGDYFAFLINPEKGLRLGNLCWKHSHTHSVSQIRKGIKAKGEAHGRSKLNQKMVDHMRSMYKAGETTQKEIAKMYGVDRSTVSSILNGKTWDQQVTKKGKPLPTVSLSGNVYPDTKKYIKALANEKNITIGEAINLIVQPLIDNQDNQ